MKLYLAHPLIDRKWVREWELKLEKISNIEFMNPFYDNPKESDAIQKIDAGKIKRYDVSIDCEDIVEGDLELIKNSDGVFAILTSGLSIGTFMEIFYAGYILKKPVYVFAKDKKDLIHHPWIKYLSAKRFTNKKDTEKFFKKLEGTTCHT